MKHTILVYLIIGLLIWWYYKRTIRNAAKGELPFINPDFVESIFLIAFLFAWFPLLIYSTCIKIKYKNVSIKIKYMDENQQ